MVSGNHLHHHASLLALAHRFDGFWTRRVNHPLQAEERKSPGDVAMFKRGVGRAHIATRECEHAQSTRGHPLDSAMNGLSVERGGFPTFVERVVTALEHSFHSANFVNYSV